MFRVRDLDAFEGLEPAWKALQQRVPEATVFSTWQWNAPAARQFARDRLEVRLFETDGTVVGIAPLARRRHLGLRALVLLGGGLALYSMADYGDLLIAPDREHNVLEALVNDLERDASWDELWLQELPELPRRR